MKRLYSIWAFVALICLFPAKQAVHAQSAIDQILVTVNSVPITESEIESRVNWLKFLAENAGQSNFSASTARKQAMDDAIVHQLLDQLAKNVEVSVSENEVQEHLTGLIESNSISEAQFFNQLESQGVSRTDMALSIYESVLNDKLVERFVIPRINIRDEEISRYIETNPDEFRPIDEFDLSVIVVSESLTMSFEQKQFMKQVVRDIQHEVEKGADFYSLSAAASRLNQVQAGDLGWVQKSQLDPQLAQTLSPSKVNKVVGPVISGPNTFFAFIKRHRVGSGPDLPTLREIRLSRIVMQASNEAGSEANAAKLNELRNSILDGADFAEIAKVYSHDAETRKEGGDLGWVPEDSLPIQYIDPLSATNVGGVTPVEQVGNIVFILHLRDIREAGPQERAESLARNRLRNFKLRSERANWLDELRENAVIDFRTTF